MSGLEQAIRNALERAERSDPDIRARIYQSARNALEVGLRKQEISDSGVIERQRARLESTIREIEDEEMARLRAIAQFERVALEREPEDVVPPAAEMPAVLPDDSPSRGSVGPEIEAFLRPEAPPVAVGDEASNRARPPAPPVVTVASPTPGRVEPTVEIAAEPRAADPRRKPDPAGEDDWLSGVIATRDDGRPSAASLPARVSEPAERTYAPEDIAPEPRRRSRSGSFLVSAFVYLFLIGIIGGGVWWVYATGMIDVALKGEGDFQLVPDALRDKAQRPVREQARLDTLRGFSGDWIDIFKPGAAGAAIAPRAKAAIDEHRDSDGLATIITSNAPDQDGDVLIDVPAGLLQDLAGKTSTIAVTVKSNTDKPAHIYIQCEFKTLGDCGRHRYTVTNERADELIQVRFDGKMAPSSDGHIVINSDLTGEGSSIRLYGIRVLPGT